MSRRWQTCILCSAAIALLVFAARLSLVSRASTKLSIPTSNKQVPSPRPNKIRNLVLQPEAAAVNRRIGNRFKSANARSVVAANLTIGNDQKHITIIRRQTDSGEAVEVLLAGRKFTWAEAEGIRGTNESPNGAERLLIERLVLDSPDQFVLAQLRGASYQTIVRHLRPTDAGEDYSGPLWTMVRVNDPRAAENVGPRSPWRLYYINSNSGLIDRIESDLDGQRIEASILQWTDQSGEKIPVRIRWTTGGQMLMEYQLTSFSQG